MLEGDIMRYLHKNSFILYIVLVICLAGTVFLSNYCVGLCKDVEDENMDNNIVSDSIIFSLSGSTEIDLKSTNDYYVTDVDKLFTSDDNTCTYFSGMVHYSDRFKLEDIISEMNNSGIFQNVEADATLYTDVVPSSKTDSYMAHEWYLDAINTSEAWKTLNKAPGEGVVVAVIDTGVDYTHGDLKNSMWVNEQEAYGIRGYDDDGNGVIDDVYGANFTTETTKKYPGSRFDIESGEGDPADTDPDGHGTHVAGIIAMSAANGGGCGIAYGAKIMAVKAGNSDGSFSVTRVINALNYAVDNGADVINMSFGSPTESNALKAALSKASEKCVLVAAAGNDGKTTSDSGYPDAIEEFPAAYPYVLGVMASDKDNNIPQWSNYDYEPCTAYDYEITAPGYNILSSVLNSRYNYMSGTSMAAPMVSAAAAIILSSIDKNEIDDPVKYTWGQLTQATTHKAVRADESGVIHTYPELNIYDSLTVKPSISLSVGSNIYYDMVSNRTFTNSFKIEQGNEADIYCGFKLNNLWRKAKNVTVSVSTTSDVCDVEDSIMHIKTLSACSNLNISYDDYESLSFYFHGKSGGTYIIPLKFKVTGQLDSDSNYVYEKEYTDTITITVADEIIGTVQSALNVQNNIDNPVNSTQNAIQNSEVAATSSAIPTPSTNSDKSSVAKPSKVKGMSSKIRSSGKGKKIVLTWKKAKGAKKYVVYISSKMKKGYKKYTTVSKCTCTYTASKKQSYYFRIRAYAGTSMKVYGKFSAPIKVKI